MEAPPELAALFRPGGHAVGIVACGSVGDDVRELLGGLLRAHGQAPLRRLALLRPRRGETQLRVGDATDFLVRYGHEYALAWLPLAPGSGPAAGSLDVAALVAAARAGGVAVVIADATNGSAPLVAAAEAAGCELVLDLERADVAPGTG